VLRSPLISNIKNVVLKKLWKKVNLPEVWGSSASLLKSCFLAGVGVAYLRLVFEGGGRAGLDPLDPEA